MYFYECIVSEKKVDLIVLFALVAHHTPNLVSCNILRLSAHHSPLFWMFLRWRLTETMPQPQNQLAMDRLQHYALILNQLQNRTLATQFASWRFCTTVHLYGFKRSNFVDACTDDLDMPVISCDNNLNKFHRDASNRSQISSSVSPERIRRDLKGQR
jgi:hypothetical protein